MSRSSIFCRIFFCLTVLNNFVGEPFSVSLISGNGTVWIRGGGGIKIFRLNFLSHSAENFRRGILTVALISGMEKVRMREGAVSRISIKIFLSHSAEQFP